MHKYSVQVGVYTQYFFKVIRDTPGVLIYTICLPLVFLIMNVSSAFFKPLSLTTYTAQVVPYIGWMIFSNCLTTASNVAILREQGYLKQYRTLVVSPAVFLVSQALVSLGIILMTLLLVALLSAITFKLAFLSLLGRLWLTVLLAYLPVTCFGLPLIALALRRKTVDTIENALALIVVVGTFMLSNMLAVSASNPLLNLVSPIYLVTNVFAMISVGPVSHFITTYLLSLIVLLVIGGLSYRHIKILPTEGL